MNDGLMLALLIGIAFGIALESAGLGNARKLASLFYLADFTVLKVMFSAILTAMLGAFWLARIGLIDLDTIYVPETWLWPQLVGGALFGVGFAVSGLCPGTACVSAASGRLDGIAVVGGIFAGVLIAGLSFAVIEPFYDSGFRGVMTVPQVTGLPRGVVVLIVTLVAICMFRMASALEARA